jgi:hypothetical protein
VALSAAAAEALAAQLAGGLEAAHGAVSGLSAGLVAGLHADALAAAGAAVAAQAQAARARAARASGAGRRAGSAAAVPAAAPAVDLTPAGASVAVARCYLTLQRVCPTAAAVKAAMLASSGLPRAAWALHCLDSLGSGPPDWQGADNQVRVFQPLTQNHCHQHK